MENYVSKGLILWKSFGYVDNLHLTPVAELLMIGTLLEVRWAEAAKLEAER